MDEQLRNLKAYSRSEEQQTKTFKEIQHLARIQKKKDRIKLVSTYLSAATLLFILIASFISNPSPSFETASGGKEIIAVERFSYEPTPWYNLHRNNMRLKDENLALFASYVNRLETEDVSSSIDNSRYYYTQPYLAIYDDRTYERFTVMGPQDYDKYDTMYFFSQETLRTIAIPSDEYKKYFIEDYITDSKPKWELPLRLLGVLILFIFYLAAVKRINPHLRTTYFYSPTLLKFGIKIVTTLILIAGVYYTTWFIAGYPHLLMAWILILTVSILRPLAENYRGDYHRSWWEVPVTILVYCVGFCILYV